MGKTRLLIVSPQALYRHGIEHSLFNIEDIEIVSATGIDEDMMKGIDMEPPDVVIIDIDGSQEKLTTARSIKQRFSNTGIIVMASAHQDAQLFEALKAQASAYISKEIEPSELVTVIRRVANGEHPINECLTTRPRVAEQVLEQFKKLSWENEAEPFISPLTSRETEILEYIARGFLNKQIAVELGISEQTIKNHVTSILRKLNANARTEAVVVAIRQGLITIA